MLATTTKLRLLATALAFSMLMACAAKLPASDTGSTPPQWLVDKAKDLAAATGDPSPSDAEFALTTGAQDAPAVGTTNGDSKTQEYLVVLTGDFEYKNAYGPPDAPPPSGAYLVFSLDPETHLVNDLGVTKSPPDLSQVGPMQQFTFDETASTSPTGASTTPES